MSRLWAVRTPKNGQIKIDGVIYRVWECHKPYDGRLDDIPLMFGRYPASWLIPPYEPFVNLWGTAEAARLVHEGRIDEYEALPNPCVVDGILPWECWGTEEHHRRTAEIHEQVMRSMRPIEPPTAEEVERWMLDGVW